MRKIRIAFLQERIKVSCALTTRINGEFNLREYPVTVKEFRFISATSLETSKGAYWLEILIHQTPSMIPRPPTKSSSPRIGIRRARFLLNSKGSLRPPGAIIHRHEARLPDLFRRYPSDLYQIFKKPFEVRRARI